MSSTNRRPPRGPSSSATLRPKSAREAAAITTSSQFRRKVQRANPNTICNSTSDRVGRMPLREILTSDTFCVPIFQRRYCWSEIQWRTLFEDAAGAMSASRQHSLGRLTCTRVVGGSSSSSGGGGQNASRFVGVEGRSCILDGQQRFTTVTILLAAIRDLLLQLKGQEVNLATIHSVNTLVQSIDGLLFADPVQLRAYLEQGPVQLEDGAELPFARLTPTFCDRWSYFTALLPLPDDATAEKIATTLCLSNSTWHRPLQAKHFFRNTLHQQDFTTVSKLRLLLRGVLDGLTMLYFPINIDTDDPAQNDGTDDLMVIYERLALRDATFCKPMRDAEHQPMDGADMIRNLLLGSFANTTDALDFYKLYWLPVEKSISDRLNAKSMRDVLRAYLDSQQAQPLDCRHEQSIAVPAGIIGGQIYADFHAWFGKRLASTTTSSSKDSDEDIKTHQGLEEQVRRVGQELLVFGLSLE